MKIDTQTLDVTTLRGVRAAYNLCFRDGLSFEDHFAQLGGSAHLILGAAEEMCQMAYDGKTVPHSAELSAGDRDAIIVALRVVAAAQDLLHATGWDCA